MSVKAHLAPARTAAGLLMLSGQLAFDGSGGIDGDISLQTTRCLERLEAVLKEYGLDRNALIKTTVWLTSADSFSAFDAAYAGFFGDHRPARSTTVAALVVPSALVEIEGIAKL